MLARARWRAPSCRSSSLFCGCCRPLAALGFSFPFTSASAHESGRTHWKDRPTHFELRPGPFLPDNLSSARHSRLHPHSPFPLSFVAAVRLNTEGITELTVLMPQTPLFR
ncbi:hypothetical protein JIQ42_08009 [Leishmania sp. Namibia]|uniref:hypothetical protein n=1 Tax=Leishmania sp. Namibia TaxID=2802991 RepID=UPI001B7C464E|nr:hypothetical protein JIQ42_08009 [Leishmania sp. Namibia]